MIGMMICLIIMSVIGFVITMISAERAHAYVTIVSLILAVVVSLFITYNGVPI